MKSLVALALTLAVPVIGANATPPPAHGQCDAGWGMNPNEWTLATNSWSEWGLYDPLYGGAGAAWVVDWADSANPTYIDYADIVLELWIEMYALQAYEYLSYQWHRLGNNDELINFIIEGTIQSNNGQYISLVPGADPLDSLYFREDIFGRTGSQYGGQLPITWYGRYGTGLVPGDPGTYVWPDNSGSWEQIDPGEYGAAGEITIPIPDPCDHWFQFKGEFHLDYHVEDGYYSLTMDGCPAPIM